MVDMNDIPDDVRTKMIEDLGVLARYEPAHKDIFVVVHNQLEYVRPCLESVLARTENFTLWVWNNNSGVETSRYLDRLADDGKIKLHNYAYNDGFIKPCNRIFTLGKAPYAVLLNSDTEVAEGWDRAMIAYLQANENVGVVGYQGGVLDENGRGGKVGSGYGVDYIAGWCLAVRRSDITLPLFDSKNLTFAYGEDSDLALRLREKGLVPYAIHLGLVMHHGNKTVLEVSRRKPCLHP
jgi:GT2 family glycosyltransferase